MPQLNRDKESLYPPGKLSLWFLATSALLVVAVFWLLADDFRRPWKGIQRAFFEKKSELLAIRKDVEEARFDAADSADHARLVDVDRRLAAARLALEQPLADGKSSANAEIARLQARIAETSARIEDAKRDIKALKGSSAAVRNAFESARLAKDAAGAARLGDQLGGIMDRLVIREHEQSADEAAQKGLQASVDALLAPVKALEKERAGLVKDLSSATTALEGTRAKVESNQWRNLPMADIIAPTIAIEKVVLAEIHEDKVYTTAPRVDMCMTCHRGADDPLFSASERDPGQGIGALLQNHLRLTFGDKAWTTLGKEPALLEKTSPARVRAWLTASGAKLDDILPRARLEEVIGKDAYARLVEGRDLLAPFRLEAVQWAHPHLELMVGATSKHAISSTGCTVCHAGVGRRLDFTRATHTPDSEEEAKRWEHEHGWSESGREYVDFPMIPARYIEGQCVKCHRAVDPFQPKVEALVQWDVALDKAGRPLVDAEGHTGFLDAEGRKGAATSGTPRLDAAGRPLVTKDGAPLLVRRRAPLPVDGDASAVDGRWHPKTLERGLATIKEWGCLGCHMIKDFEHLPGYGDPRGASDDPGADLSRPATGALTKANSNPKLGPDLTHLADKTTKEWVARWLNSPNSYRLDTRMPSFYRWRAHDDQYKLVLGADGKPQDVPLVADPTSRDLDQIEVEVRALSAFLIDASATRAATYPELPPGDVKRGAKTFYTVGCYGCHVGPGGWDLKKGEWAEGLADDGARFRIQGDALPPGPRLTSIGSKYKDAKTLAAWIDEPRHYNSVTRMPNVLQGRPELAADNKTVVRSAIQIRADLAAYLMAFKDPAFDAQPRDDEKFTFEQIELLNDFWIEWYGATDPENPARAISKDEARKIVADLKLPRKLFDVGRKLVGVRGCFGCHNVKGYENEQPIGKDLSIEGSQDLHQFDFGLLPHDEVPHTRWDWIETKLKNPRVYDRGRHKPRWADKLRMPRFNFTAADRESVVAVVLGLVNEPIKPAALPKPTPATEAIAKGRAVIQRYGCAQCHTIEGRRGVLTAEQLDRGMELWMLPPNLYGEGNRVHADWLFQFLKNPYLHQPDGVRPATVQRMPMFRLSDDEASALVDYFFALAGRKDRLATDPEDEPLDDTPYKEPVVITVKEKDEAGKEIESKVTVNSLREEAKALFDRRGCVKCHLPKGAPGTESGEGASAPPFTLAGKRLTRAWMGDLLHNPQNQIPGTKMPSFWPGRSLRGKPAPPPNSMDVTFPQFLVGARFLEKPTNDDIAEAQMSAIVRYLRHHYESPAPAAGK